MAALFYDIFKLKSVSRTNEENPHVSWYNGFVAKIYDEMYPLTLPYMPNSRPDIIVCDELLTDRKNGDFDTIAILYIKKADGEADLWTYSFPCTDISNAGKMLGISWDTRSGLLLQVGRLLNESLKREELPEYLVMENVSNLLSHKFIEDFNRWLEFLDCLGYDNRYAVLNACDFGLPQNRNRVFLVSRLRSCGGLDNFVMPQGSGLQKSVIDFLDPIRERERENDLSL